LEEFLPKARAREKPSGIAGKSRVAKGAGYREVLK
jgi:hypothetical protein